MNYYRYQKRRKARSVLEKAKNFSVVALIIVLTLVVSVLVFALTAFYCTSDVCNVLNYTALKPSSILAGKFLWTLVTHIFVHGGIGHLIVNMFVLFSLGSLAERIIGRKRFFWLYILSGIFAGVLSVVLSGLFGSSGIGEKVFGSPDIFMVGASGAIFAIAGLYVVLLPRLKFGIIFFPFFSFPGYIMIPAVLFIMWAASIAFNFPIGNVAHFGGFIAGMIYGFYLKSKYRNKVLALQRMFR